ncbi:MAG: DUF882 domain-containing protein [Gammaproteobacteria bacterium]|nr:DUF882 domain-containing protein [Gammaproteobacteria bacterium]
MIDREIADISTSRRTFLCGSLLLPSVFLSDRALALPPHAQTRPADQIRRLQLANDHTGEQLDVVYWKNGEYIDDHIGQLNYFMRDHRENKSFLMDVKLYEFLSRLYKVLNPNVPIHVLSGYRTAATNAALIKASSGVAKNSFHMVGKAVDFYIPGIDNKLIQREARRLMLGGVGYYTKSGFIHLDTGYPRSWSDA